MMRIQLALISASVLFANALAANNVVEDVNTQAGKLIRCWEQVRETRNGEEDHSAFKLSDPIYSICSYMVHPRDAEKFFVRGVDMNSDDYEPMITVLNGAGVSSSHAVINLCLQEGYNWHYSRPSEISIRCLCRRDGCNVALPFSYFLKANQIVLPKYP